MKTGYKDFGRVCVAVMLNKIPFILLLLLYSCSVPKKNSDCLLLGETTNFKGSQSEYKQSIKNFPSDSISKQISFVFANNPYCLDSSYLVKLFANNSLLYEGVYAVGMKAETSQIEKKVPTHFILEIITPVKNGKVYLHSFQDKSVMSWREEYNLVYIGFFPANDETNRIHFFPQIESVIQ